ncbi:fused response regulator/phosphatase [Caminibacter profundus]
MEVCIIDDNKTFLKHIENRLKKIGFHKIKLFYTPIEIIQYVKNNSPEVIMIDYFLPKTNGIDLLKILKKLTPETIFIMITASKDEKIKSKALKSGVDDFLNKDITFSEFQAKMNMIKKLISLSQKEKQLNEILKKEIEYKSSQEKLAIIKHKKIIKNELSMFFETKHLIESYYKPKDILNGDTVFSKKLNENEFVISIIDAMGKGLSASLTSINVTTFLEHSIDRSIKLNDFNFQRTIQDFINYSKSILLDKEILCANIIYIKNEELFFANFGMPPIYTPNKKYKSNNPPISKHLKNINISSIPLPEKFFILSDGILESRLKNINSLYYGHFIKNINADFLKKIITDFKENAFQEDDVSIVHYFQDNINNKIYEIEEIIKDKDSIDKLLLKIPINLILYQKIIFILQELLMNTLEHGIYGLQVKKEKVSINNSKPINDHIKVKISIYKKDDLIKLLFEEDSKGFDINILNDINICKYHGRGIKIIKSLSEGLFFNHKGNKIKIFLKEIK